MRLGERPPAPAVLEAPRHLPAARFAFMGVVWGSTAAASIMALALTLAGYLLSVDDRPTAADAIVVLGGFGVPRAELAARLYALGAAPRLLVTGSGDCAAMRDVLVAHGVPRAAIVAECGSRSTFENASFSTPLLRRDKIGSAILVTHWFHARRALASFRQAAPEVGFAATAVSPAGIAFWRLGWASEPRATLAEYAKIVWYALKHGVVVGPEPEPETHGARP